MPQNNYQIFLSLLNSIFNYFSSYFVNFFIKSYQKPLKYPNIIQNYNIFSNKKKINESIVIFHPQNDYLNNKNHNEINQNKILYFTNRLQKLLIHNQNITNIFVVLDSFPFKHISHPEFWTDQNQNHPKPNIIISLQDILKKKYQPSLYDHHYIYTYLKKLNIKQIMISKKKCVIHSSGQQIIPSVFELLQTWQKKNKNNYLSVIFKHHDHISNQFNLLPIHYHPTNINYHYSSLSFLQKLFIHIQPNKIYIIGFHFGNSIYPIFKNDFSFIQQKNYNIHFITDLLYTPKSKMYLEREFIKDYIFKNNYYLTSSYSILK